MLSHDKIRIRNDTIENVILITLKGKYLFTISVRQNSAEYRIPLIQFPILLQLAVNIKHAIKTG